MKSKLTRTLIVGFFAGTSAWAANKVGNGGDVIVCDNKVERTVTLLDFYESPPEITSKELDPFTLAQERLKVFESVSPKLAKMYAKRVQEIKDQIEFREGVRLIDIADSKHLFEPKESHCQRLQIAIRRISPLPNEKPFLLDAALWKELSTVQQAGLITHELLFEHLAKLGEQDSRNVRKINQWLFTKQPSPSRFWEMIKAMKIPLYPE